MTLREKACTVAVLGGDARQRSAARALVARGIHVLAWGMGEWETEGIFFVSDWREAVASADALLLPLPVSTDGMHLHCPLSADEGVCLDPLLASTTGKLILGGRLSSAVLSIAQRRGVRCVDYFASECLQIRNALPTAEGAISVAMQELPVTLDGTRAAVIGYGRIGEVLSQRLYALGMHVTVYARRREVLAHAVLNHCDALLLDGENPAVSLVAMPRDVRVIFNTVPVRLFDADVISRIPAGCVFIDLASAPGGIDREAAERSGVRCIWATSLPGKYAPETAGQIIADTAREILLEEGLL